MKRISIIKIVLIFLAFGLFIPNISFARRTKNADNIAVSLHQILVGIGYEQEAGEINALILEIFPDFGDLKALSPQAKIVALADIIKQNISAHSWSEGEDLLYFELSDVLNSRKSICFGYAELFYVLGKTLGLDVEVIPIYPGHGANLIKLDSGHVVLDLANELVSNYYQSQVFNWDENYQREGSIWCLKEGSNLPQIYKIVQRVNEQGIIEGRYYNRGWMLEQAGRTNEAVECYGRATGVAQAWSNIGLILSNQGQYNEAIRYFDRAIELNPYLAETFYNRASTKIVLGLHSEAVDDCDIAIGFNSNLAQAWFNRGTALAFLKQYDEAKESFREAIKLTPDPSILSEAFYNLGLVHINLGIINKALEYFTYSAQHNQNNAEAWFHVGYCKFQLGQSQEGIEAVRKAIKLDPSMKDRLPPEVQRLL
ncbi:MAG: tetratricopeptide repeat protein [Candidatus Kaelpia imicola]|nr:tetratricopeptide repeat protein [Candidatus Kaelpia imicola]